MVKKNMNKQYGVVLLVALIFLIALTAVAAALMQSTTSDIKMSGANEEKVVAMQEVISALDEIIFREVNGGSGNNLFASPLVVFDNQAAVNNAVMADLTTTNKTNDTVASIELANNEYKLESDCPHSESASSTGVFTCNMLRVSVEKKYGRKLNGNNKSSIEISSAIAQQLLK